GLWLEQLGFAIGTKLRITASEGQLLMEVLPLVEVPAKQLRARR
ncbi:SymE family type I addiction module toxin, partial [Xanthomonas phaseoli]